MGQGSAVPSPALGQTDFFGLALIDALLLSLVPPQERHPGHAFAANYTFSRSGRDSWTPEIEDPTSMLLNVFSKTPSIVSSFALLGKRASLRRWTELFRDEGLVGVKLRSALTFQSCPMARPSTFTSCLFARVLQ